MPVYAIESYATKNGSVETNIYDGNGNEAKQENISDEKFHNHGIIFKTSSVDGK
jgi:hypothetical protein